VHEVGSAEELRARARGTAHTLFTYCMAYTMEWFGGARISGPGASEGAAAARRDMATQQALDPNVLTRVREQGMAGAQELYTAAYGQMAPFAEQSLMRSTESDEGSLDAMVIHDRISQVRWNGPLFLEFGS